MAENSSELKPRWWWEFGVAALLFLATAAVVVWQNSRLGVLWDLSYILENSNRISLGDLPYRDFPFPYAPLTFMVQAAIIKLTGRVFWHHIVYCAIIGGLGTVVTWRIVLCLLRIRFRMAYCLPLCWVVWPIGNLLHLSASLYDPDSTFVICSAPLLTRLTAKVSAADFLNWLR